METKLNAEEALSYLITVIKINLEELCSPPSDADCRFVHGEKTAYVECLEILQRLWNNAEACGLTGDIERVYPV